MSFDAKNHVQKGDHRFHRSFRHLWLLPSILCEPSKLRISSEFSAWLPEYDIRRSDRERKYYSWKRNLKCTRGLTECLRAGCNIAAISLISVLFVRQGVLNFRVPEIATAKWCFFTVVSRPRSNRRFVCWMTWQLQRSRLVIFSHTTQTFASLPGKTLTLSVLVNEALFVAEGRIIYSNTGLFI